MIEGILNANYYLIEICIISYVCSKVIEESKYTATLLHRIKVEGENERVQDLV